MHISWPHRVKTSPYAGSIYMHTIFATPLQSAFNLYAEKAESAHSDIKAFQEAFGEIAEPVQGFEMYLKIF